MPSSFNDYIVRYAKDEQKMVVYYLYRADQEVSLDFKAISMHPLFGEDCVFLSLRDPDAKHFQGLDVRALPTIGVVQAIKPDFQDGMVTQNHVNANLKFDALLRAVAEVAGKTQEYNDML